MDKVAIIYIDFDDTLYTHEVHWGYDEDFDYNILFGFKKIQYVDKYLNHELVNKVQVIRKYYESIGVKCIINLLTGCRTNVYFKSKTDFLDAVTPGLFTNYFSVASQEEKILMIKAFNKEIKRDNEIVNVLVIDDGYGVTSACQNIGINAITPGYFEKHYCIEE